MKYCLLFILTFFSFISLGQENEFHFYPFKDSRGWGVKRADGIALFPARYDSILISNYLPYKNRIRVQENGKWGIVDSAGKVKIPLIYSFIENDEFGYDVGDNESWLNSTAGFLGFNGDTIVPFEHAFYSTLEIGNQGDFLVIALKDKGRDMNAIYSSDGIRRTEYEFDEVIGIDSVRFFKSIDGIPSYYFGLHSLKNDKCGVYDGLNKRIVVPPIYDYVCSGWCALSENPLFHPGPIAYTGTTPIFHMQLGDEYRLINVQGEVIFLSKQVSGFDDTKKYYVNEKGEAREVVGKCPESDDNFAPPYVMKDDAGYFLVDRDGNPQLGSKRYPYIAKFNHSKLKEQEFNRYSLEDEYHLKSMLDHTLKERIPPNYLSISFYGNTLVCRKGTGEFDFYDSTFVKLENDPRIQLPKHNFFYEESVEHGTARYGVRSKDSVVLTPAIYRLKKYVSKWETESDTGFYILTDPSGALALFNEEIEKVMHFDADSYRFYSRFYANRRVLLVLMNKTELSIFELETKDWLMKDQLCISQDSINKLRLTNQHVNLGPKLEIFAGQLFFWIYNLETGWNLFNEEGRKLLQWNRKTASEPSIIFMNDSVIFALQRISDDDGQRIYFVNNQGDELAVQDELFDVRFVPEMNRVFLSFRSKHKYYNVYDNEFNFVEEINGSVYSLKDEPFYIHFDRKAHTCEVVTKQGIQVLTDAVNVSSVGEGIFTIGADSTNYLVTQFSYDSLKRYWNEPSEVTKMVLSCPKEGFIENRKLDFYDLQGKLLFENYELAHYRWFFHRDDFFIIKNDDEELWLTENGVVYHRNPLGE